MNCCVKNPLWLGCFSNCGSINLGVVATVAGIHTAVFEGESGKVVIQRVFSLGQPIIYPLEYLNEEMSYTVTVKNPVGIEMIGGVNDGWAFRTSLVKNIVL